MKKRKKSPRATAPKKASSSPVKVGKAAWGSLGAIWIIAAMSQDAQAGCGARSGHASHVSDPPGPSPMAVGCAFVNSIPPSPFWDLEDFCDQQGDKDSSDGNGCIWT